MKNYHNEEVTFTIGQTVTHVSDEGEMSKGTITEISDETLHIEFEDGEEGWENGNTCF